MTDGILPLNRRALLAGLGSLILRPPLAAAAGRLPVIWQAKSGVATLPGGTGATPVWSLAGPTPDAAWRFKRGDDIEVNLENQLPIPIALALRGLDGAAEAELLTRPPVSAGSRAGVAVALRDAGSFLCDLRLIGDGQARPLPARALIVAEDEAVLADRDELFLIEDWRLHPNGSAAVAGTEATDTTTIYTVNGGAGPDISLRRNERLRLRIINGCQRHVIALKIENQAVLVMAIDSQPAEPFLARNGQLVLAPGSRIDAFIDAIGPPGTVSPIVLHDGTEPRPIGRLVTSSDAAARATALPPPRPLPASSLPAQLELKNAHRVEMTLGEKDAHPGWTAPISLTTATAAVFRVKPGRVVVLALTNRAAIPMVFHLHGHHFRLLDRLDDGWKPFWLDTLAIDAGQTQRIAFAAQYPGRWLMEAMATNWAAPRLARWYGVE